MRKFFREFKEFAMKGSVIDLAVAVITGNAVNNIVNSLAKNIFMPIISIFVGRVDVKSLKLEIPSRLTLGSAITLNYGEFLQSLLDFLTTMLCIFIMIKFVKKLTSFPTIIIKGRTEEEEEAKPTPPKTEDLLVEIRDLLKEQSAPKAKSDLPDNLDQQH